jgi:hypothetical protein
LATETAGTWSAFSKAKKDMPIKDGKLNNYGRI